jgi:hypothetical protein
MQDNLMAFIRSITVTDPQGNRSISPAVFAISVGNEVDQTFQDQAPNGLKIGNTNQDAPLHVNAASKLARVEWWMVNLEEQLAKIPGGDKVLLTSPISTADLGAGTLSWFQAFVDGVKQGKEGEKVPHDTHNGNFQDKQNGVFDFSFVAKKNGQPLPDVTGPIRGLATLNVPGVRPYTQWYINTYQAYQNPLGFKLLLQKYDNGGSSSPYSWPGQKFDVPLLITEMGVDRNQEDPQVKPADKGRAINLTAEGQAIQSRAVQNRARAIEEYLAENKGRSEAMGYTIFEYNDEPTRKTGAESLFGLEMMAGTQPSVILNGNSPGKYPRATLLFNAKTNNQKFAGGPLGPEPYPVQQLFPVVDGQGKTLLNDLKAIYRGDAS